jgi:hypothetical protein
MVASNTPDPLRPLWVPEGVRVEDLPPTVQAAVAEIINPLYQELVLEAPSALLRLCGLQIAHMAWLIVVGQRDLAAARTAAEREERDVPAFYKALERHLRAVKMSDTLTKTVMQLRQHEETRVFRDELPLPDQAE